MFSLFCSPFYIKTVFLCWIRETNLINSGCWVEQAKFWFLHYASQIYSTKQNSITFCKNRDISGAETAGGRIICKTKNVIQTDCVTFHFMEMRFYFCSYPLSCGCWLSLIVRCTTDSSNCNFALLLTSNALTLGRSKQASLKHYLLLSFQHWSHLHNYGNPSPWRCLWTIWVQGHDG